MSDQIVMHWVICYLYFFLFSIIFHCYMCSSPECRPLSRLFLNVGSSEHMY